MAKEKIVAAFARLDRLDLGENDGDTIDPHNSTRRADLFTLVAPHPRYSTQH